MIYLNNEYPVPSDWHEISNRDQLYLFRLWCEYGSGAIPQSEFKLQAFLRLAKVRVAIRTLIGIRIGRAFPNHRLATRAREIASNSLVCYDQVFGYLLDADGRLQIKGVDNLVPTLWVGWRKVKTPEELFANLTFGQFRVAYELMSSAAGKANNSEPGSDYDFECAMSVLCCAGEFKISKAIRRAKRFRHLKKWQREYLLAWFFRTVEYIQNDDINIGAAVFNFSALFPKSDTNKSSPTNVLGWTGVLYDVAALGVLGNTEKVDKAGLYDVLQLLLNELRKNEQK